MRSAFAHLSSPAAFAERPAGWGLTITRWTSGVIFVSFGAGKFIDHAAEATSFQAYGLPSPGVFTDAIGVLELAGGVLLLLGLGTRVVAALLAGDMVGAIIVSGLLRDETISLTLAPALLLAMLALIALGPGQFSLDRARRRRLRVDADRNPLTRPAPVGRARSVTNRNGSESDAEHTPTLRSQV
jgi:putative oxidoreductase